MDKMKVIYSVNGVASNVWRRMAGSKTFWVCALFVLGSAQGWNEGLITGAAFVQICQVGLLGILIRAATSKAEMASNALNPDVEHVEAVSQVKISGGGYSAGVPMFILMAFVLCLSLSGCGAAKAASGLITNPDGKPVITAEICVNTPNGKVCYVPNEPTIIKPPAEVPADVAQVPASTLAMAPPGSGAVLLPGPVSYNEVSANGVPPPFPVRPQLAK